MTVRVVHGANDRSFPVAGRTVSFVATNLRDVFNIPPVASAFLNGQEAGYDVVLNEGDCLEFVKTFGNKGCGSEYLSVAEVRRMVGEKGIRELGSEGIVPKTLPVYETNAVLRWLNERLELDSLIMRKREAVSANGLTVDPETLQASFKGETVVLQVKPFEVLYLLVKGFRPGRKLAIDDLKDSVWQDDFTSDDTLRRTISRLRKAVGKLPGVKLQLADKRVELSID